MSDKTLNDMILKRNELYQVFQERRALGTFDANSGTILTLLEAQVATMNYLITAEKEAEEKKKK